MSARRKGREGLSIQEALFVEAYLACNCNGTEAARRVNGRQEVKFSDA